VVTQLVPSLVVLSSIEREAERVSEDRAYLSATDFHKLHPDQSDIGHMSMSSKTISLLD
jgi:hypothetical protein